MFDLDGVVAGFGAADLKRGKTRPSKTPGLSQLVIDLKKRRFAVKGSGLLLPGLPAMFMVRLRADDDTACALLPLERLGKLPSKPPTKPKAVKQPELQQSMRERASASICRARALARSLPTGAIT